jgi:hypothetical protein
MRLTIDPTLCRKKMNTPLHVACEKGFPDAIKVLAAAGASLKIKNKAHKTPWDLCQTDEARFALPGGFSKVKGEKANWKEADPEGFKQAQAEVAKKKAEKAASRPAPKVCPQILDTSLNVFGFIES